MPTVGAHPVPALPSPVLASRLAAAIARRGHPASMSDADWRACAQDLDAHVVGPAELERGGQRIRVDGRTAIVTGAGVSTRHDVGPRPSALQLEAEAVLAGILREHPLCCAVSGGKDSAATLALALNAARQLAEAGDLRMPVIVSSADTGVESPEVVHIRTELLAAAGRFAARHCIPLITRVSTPRLTERWWPRMLAGRKLPSWAGAKADCTVDMKIKPQVRAQAAIAAELAAQGLPAPVLCVGTRYAESQRRASNMRDRGEGAELADGRIAPIADWSDVEVFDFLADIRAPKLPFDWSLLLDFYANAGAECVIVPDPALRGTQGQCGARSGCFVCQAVTTDRSAQALVEHDDYAYLKPLLALNRYLGAIRYDWGRRHWVARALDPATGEARIGPQGFSWQECRELLRMLLTLDAEERERAERVRASLAAGAPGTPRTRRLARPQFQNIGFEELLAVDFMSSVDGHGPEHWPLLVWDDVVSRGARYPVPDITPVPRTPLPVERRAPVDLALQHAPGAGLSDPVAEAFGAPPAFVPGGRAGIRLNPLLEGERAFEVDPEAAGLFEAFEFDEVVARARTAALPVGSAARYYLRLGTIQVPKSQASSLDMQMRRTAAKATAGLAGAGPDIAARQLSRS